MTTGIIGYGTLGSAVFRSIYRLDRKTKFIISIKTHEKRYTNIEVAQRSSDLFLCVKPSNAEEVCKEIKGYINKDTVVVSVMAAVPFVKIQEWLDHENVVKTMPTISIPKGPVTVYNPYNLKFKRFSENYITVDDEKILDMSTAVSGCMPGFLANIMKQWIDAAITLGIDPVLAEELVCSNVYAFKDLNISDRIDLQNLQDKVASKGGATELGLIHLNESNLTDILETTMRIANVRVMNLADKLRD